MARTSMSSATSPVRARTGCTGWSRLCDHAAAVPADRPVLRAFGSVPRQNGGHSSCMQILVRTVHTVQQTVQVQFLVLVVDAPFVVQRQVSWLGLSQKTVESPQLQCLWACRVPGQGCCARRCNDCGSRNAWFDYGYMFCIIQGGFLKNL